MQLFRMTKLHVNAICCAIRSNCYNLRSIDQQQLDGVRVDHIPRFIALKDLFCVFTDELLHATVAHDRITALYDI